MEMGEGHTKEESHIIKLKQSLRCSFRATHSQDQSPYSWSPPTQPSWDNPPVYSMVVPISGIMGSIKIAELNLLFSKDEEVTAHDSDHWCEEDGEGTEDCDESCCFVDELPGLNNLRDALALYFLAFFGSLCEILPNKQ